MSLSAEEVQDIEKEIQFYHDNTTLPELEEEQQNTVESFQNVIKGRDAFLDAFNKKDKLKFTIKYKEYTIPIEIRPIKPGDDLSLLNYKPEDIYPDLTPQQIYLIQKATNGQYLSPSEQQELEGMTLEPDQQAVSEVNQRNMFKALAQNVVDPQLTEDEWADMDQFGLKAFIYAEMQERLGLNPNLQLNILP